MNFNIDGLDQELTAFCKGKGARGDSVVERMGSQLRSVCGISVLDKDGTARRKLWRWFDSMTREYAAERRTILSVRLGVHPEADYDTLGRRDGWLAERLHCGKRTVQRRADEALKHLARDAAAVGRAAAAAAEVGYVVEALKVEVVFDGNQIKVIGYRKIRATRIRLDVICWRFGLPRSPLVLEQELDLDIKVVEGGRLLGYERHRGEGDVIVCRLEPRKPIQKDETYEFKVVYVLPSEQPMPHYVVQPATAFESFDLRVRFDPSQLPSRVWRVDGVGHREIDVCPSSERVLTLGPSGELEVSFHEFDRGGSYGLAWK